MADSKVNLEIGYDASKVTAGVEQSKTSIKGLAGEVTGLTEQFVSGAAPIEMFTSHAYGLFNAISEMRGAAGGFIGFLGGPWGLAITTAVSVLWSLWEGHQKATDGQRDHQSAADALIKAVDDLDSVTGRTNRTTAQSVRDTDQATRSMRQHTIEVRENTRAELQRILAYQAALQKGAESGEPGSDGASLVMAMNGGQIAELRKMLAEQDGAIANASQALRGTQSFFITRGVDDEFDKSAAAMHRFEDAAANLRGQFDKGTISAATFRTEYRALKRELQAAESLDKIPKPSLANKISTPPTAIPQTVIPEVLPRPDVHVSGDTGQPFVLSQQTRTKFVADVKQMYDQAAKIVGPGVATLSAKWKGLADSVAGAWAQSFQGMIRGTQNFRRMMLNIGNAILGDAIKWIEKKAAAFIAKELAQTQILIMSVAARNGVEATGAATSTAISATTSLTQIAHSAAGAAANTYKVVAAQLPYGPYIAPAMAAAALAGVLALGKGIFSAKGGMGQVPHDGAMFELHKDEMVLPASLATPMRSMLLGSPASAGMPANDPGTIHNHHYHIKGMDGQDVHRVLMRHHGSVAQAAERAYRNGYKAKP